MLCTAVFSSIPRFLSVLFTSPLLFLGWTPSLPFRLPVCSSHISFFLQSHYHRVLVFFFSFPHCSSSLPFSSQSLLYLIFLFFFGLNILSWVSATLLSFTSQHLSILFTPIITLFQSSCSSSLLLSFSFSFPLIFLAMVMFSFIGLLVLSAASDL